uniref:40S ribosomal protein S27 n=1 Tax=Leersia perrieri TaxID=77586 RepID=A0A0D9W4F2_9ORYZ
MLTQEQPPHLACSHHGNHTKVDNTTVFSHSQTVVVCPGCQTVLCHPTGGKARLTEGCSFRRKND